MWLCVCRWPRPDRESSHERHCMPPLCSAMGIPLTRFFWEGAWGLIIFKWWCHSLARPQLGCPSTWPWAKRSWGSGTGPHRNAWGWAPWGLQLAIGLAQGSVFCQYQVHPTDTRGSFASRMWLVLMECTWVTWESMTHFLRHLISNISFVYACYLCNHHVVY